MVGTKGIYRSTRNQQLQLLTTSSLFGFVRLSETAPEVTNRLFRFSMSSEVLSFMRFISLVHPAVLDVIFHVLPPFGAIPVSDVIQRIFPELNAARVIGLIREFVPQLKTIQDMKTIHKLFPKLNHIEIFERTGT
jgi:hypothetical protein